MKIQDEIQKSQNDQKLHVLNGTGYKTNSEAVFIKSCVENNLIKSENKEDFLKGLGSDLEKKFPKGKWVTMSGSRVFINGGKVVAGLDGFNKEIDSFFDKKKEKKVKIQILLN